MCLGVPGRVVEIEGLVATVDFFGVRRTVSLQVVDEPVALGDYVLNHVGFAIRRIPPEEIGETLALYERLIELAEQDDLLLADLRSEIDAAGPSHERGGEGSA
jgi:hydrogenase expression/formation protein HypC